MRGAAFAYFFTLTKKLMQGHVLIPLSCLHDAERVQFPDSQRVVNRHAFPSVKRLRTGDVCVGRRAFFFSGGATPLDGGFWAGVAFMGMW